FKGETMLKKILIVAVGLVVIVGAGLFILDRTLFAPAAVSSALPIAPTIAAPIQAAKPTPTSAAPGAADQPATPAQSSTAMSATGSATVYQIDPNQSEARYEVGETFFQGNRFNLAVGRTKGIAGEVLVDFANPANSQIGTIVIDISQFKSDEGRRDNFIRNNFLQSAQYPQATFKPTKIEGLPASVKPGDSLTLKVTGELTVKETTKAVTFDVTLKADQDKVTGTATTEVLLSDFGVGPIQLAMLQTEDKAKLAFEFVALPAK
ncbi:MAG TPA: YceI family protein, partial [Anaerolineae bacterium]|nr:YceI family protein [Anaerolineae bacterium]